MVRYDPDIQAAFEQRCAAAAIVEAAATERIREILRAGQVPLGALPTEGAIVSALGEYDPGTVRRALGGLVGPRIGAQCTGPGEARVIGWDPLGCEVFGLRECECEDDDGHEHARSCPLSRHYQGEVA